MPRKANPKKRMLNIFAEIDELLGTTTVTDELIEAAESETEQDIYGNLQADALVFFLENPRAFTKRLCLVCDRSFFVNRQNVAACSDSCRKEYLANRGIKWDSTRTLQDQFGRTESEPLIIAPGILMLLEGLAESQLQRQIPSIEHESHTTTTSLSPAVL